MMGTSLTQKWIKLKLKIIKKKGIENYTAEFIALSIVEEKPVDLVYIIKNFITSLAQTYTIDIVDMGGNEKVFNIN